MQCDESLTNVLAEVKLHYASTLLARVLHLDFVLILQC